MRKASPPTPNMHTRICARGGDRPQCLTEYPVRLKVGKAESRNPFVRRLWKINTLFWTFSLRKAGLTAARDKIY